VTTTSTSRTTVRAGEGVFGRRDEQLGRTVEVSGGSFRPIQRSLVPVHRPGRIAAFDPGIAEHVGKLGKPREGVSERRLGASRDFGLLEHVRGNGRGQAEHRYRVRHGFSPRPLLRPFAAASMGGFMG
jgi:hypothetical protein